MLRHGVRFAPYPETINSEKLVGAESSLGRRPGGEAGRPGRGGYTLREVFTLKKTKMSTFKVCFQHLYHWLGFVLTLLGLHVRSMQIAS